MDWSNESILEFIELLKAEPAIWNHKEKDHRNRLLVNEAWIRLKNNFSIPCTIEDLKRKRNSLLTQYRDIIKRMKESQRVASGIREIYKPTWFAFDAMNSYLKPLYNDPATVKPEDSTLSYDEDPLSNESDSYNEIQPTCYIQSGMTSNIKRPMSWESNSIGPHCKRLSRDSNTPSEPDSFIITKKRRGMQELPAKEIKDAFSIANERSYREDIQTRDRECDLYGQLIAEKLKPLDQNDRLQLMNNIDNLVFNYLMATKK